MGYKPLPVGIEDFEQMVTKGYYFIDKTNLIKEIIDKKGAVNLFTRPRRFGKTLNLSMLQYYFEDMYDLNGEKKDNIYLFDNLDIMTAGDIYTCHMGQYPVINLSLKSAKCSSYEDSIDMLRTTIASEFDRHKYILKSDKLADKKEKFLSIVRDEAKDVVFRSSLKFLSECLYAYFGKKAIILLDEYDVPLENAFLNDFYDKMVDFIRSFFESGLKTNSNMEFAVITGCLRISKESIFTGMNNLEIISILNDSYDEYFGFTEDEVGKLCKDYDMVDKHDEIKSWYDGYLFGEANIYNPWSLIRYVKDHLENRNKFAESYWANTRSNSIVKKLIEMADDDVKREIESVIEGNSVEKPVHEDITYDEIYKNMDNLWNFMFFTGYFRKVSERIDSDDKRYLELKLPNREVKYIFREKILAWFDEKVKAKDRSKLFSSLLERDVKAFEKEVNDILLETISFNDAYESFYHGFLAGILSGMDRYTVKSNREGGKGRSDLFIKPVSRRNPAFVIEFKIADKFKDLDKMADEALKQIDDRKYVKEIEDDGYETVYKYGISFCGKDCMIKLAE